MVKHTALLPVLAAAAVALVLCGAAPAATYYVDFDGGDDAAAGTAAETPFKHCPGDTAATATAKAVALQPGDTVVLKGGVAYLGTISVKASGAEGNPIVFDGNTAGTFGEGRAVVDGALPVTGWKRCASAEEARGNPRWNEIFYVDIPKTRNWRSVNLSSGATPLAVAQDPNPSDPMFQEAVAEFHKVDRKMGSTFGGKIYFEKGSQGNSTTPLMGVLGGAPAVVQPITGGAFTIELDQPVTVTAVGIKPQPRYAAVKEFAFLADGKELLRAALQKEQADIQKFDLPEAVTASKLTWKLLSAYEGEKLNWTKIARVAAWTADGKNVLGQEVLTVIKDDTVLTQTDPHYYDGMWVGVHGGNNMVAYQQVRRYDPAAHELHVQYFGGRLYKDTKYALYNSVRLIDVPGEYSIESTADAKTDRLYLLPERTEGNAPADVRLSRYSLGFALQGASHVVVRGFRVLRQGNASIVAGLSARGPAEGVVFRDCEVSLVRGGAGITTYQVNKVLVEGCRVHHCPGHTKGIVLRNGSDVDTLGCTLEKNTSTGLDYYTCTGGRVAGNTVLDHRGMHANSLTFYLGCKDIVIESNRVARGNVALTFQQAENLLIRNNLFDGGGRSTDVGIWPGQPLKNVRILNNAFVGSNHDVSWQTGLFTNSKKIEGLVVQNNIIDGLCGDPPFPKEAAFSHNLYTRLGPDREKKNFGEGEFYEPDLKKIFVDPEAGDWRLRPGSPAIDAGTKVDVPQDIDGTPRPQGKTFDIGPYEFRAQ